MKVGFVYSEKYACYDGLIKDVIENLTNKIDKEKVVLERIINKSTRKKYDLYIFASNDIQDFKAVFEMIKCNDKVVLITENLSEEYITYAINNVIDIIYAKNNVETIIKRIIGSMNKIECVRN